MTFDADVIRGAAELNIHAGAADAEVLDDDFVKKLRQHGPLEDDAVFEPDHAHAQQASSSMRQRPTPSLGRARHGVEMGPRRAAPEPAKQFGQPAEIDERLISYIALKCASPPICSHIGKAQRR